MARPRLGRLRRRPARPGSPDRDADRVRSRCAPAWTGAAGKSPPAPAPPRSAGPTCRSPRRGACASCVSSRPSSTPTGRPSPRPRSGSTSSTTGAGASGRERQLRAALEPPRLRLLTQFNALPDGVSSWSTCVRPCSTWPRRTRCRRSRGRPQIAARQLVRRGLPGAPPDPWDTPAAIIEKLIEYEAVHEISDWDEMKSRLGVDRRCYAYFHPRMPDEPLISSRSR